MTGALGGRMLRTTAFLVVVAAVVSVGSGSVGAHSTPAYDHDSTGTDSPAFATWMSNLPDDRMLSELSLPGTHDSMATCNGDSKCSGLIGVVVKNSTQTQTQELAEQLRSGIRYLDIRLSYRQIDSSAGPFSFIPTVNEPRCGATDDPADCRFLLYHGDIYLGYEFETDVLDVVEQFLDTNPSETVLMRIKNETQSTQAENDLFESRLDGILAARSGNLLTEACRANPITLGPEPTQSTPNGPCDARGKVGIIQDYGNSASPSPYTMDHRFQVLGALAGTRIQDQFEVATNWDLYDKWIAIKEQIVEANSAHALAPEEFWANYLVASGGSFPYFIASGHSDSGNGAPRLSTGLTTPGWKNSYPDFPRTSCFWGICTISFEGTNVLTMNYINEQRVPGAPLYNGYVGLILADFPGEGLIAAIINVNEGSNGTPLNLGGPNDPPVAALSMPSFAVDEGSLLTLDGSPSSDPNGDPLEYEWTPTGEGADACARDDSDGAAIRAYAEALEDFRTSNPDLGDDDLARAFDESDQGQAALVALNAEPDDLSRAHFTCPDDASLEVKLEVSDGTLSDAIVAPVEIRNVAPTVIAQGSTINESGLATVSGTITDPGVLDNFTIEIDWGDGTTTSHSYPAGSTTYSEDHRYLDDNPTGTPADVYPITVRVLDDDGGVGSDSALVTVNNVNPIATVTGTVIAEDGTATIQLKVDDPGTEDTFDVVIDWGEGLAQLETLPASVTGTQLVSYEHRYLDDNPTGTPTDDYTVTVTVTDDDTGTDTETTTVTVNNVAPVVTLDSIVDELGNDLVGRSWPALVGLEVDIDGTFTDVGTQDTFIASVDWGDSMSEPILPSANLAASHAYAVAGTFDVELAVMDDDTGRGSAVDRIVVLDACGVAEWMVELLNTEVARPESPSEVDELLSKVNDKLVGNNDGEAANGACDMLAKGNENAGAVMFGHAAAILLEVHSIDPRVEGERLAELLALATKSVALEAIQTQNDSGDRNAQRRTDVALGHLVSADSLLREGQIRESIERYRAAIRSVH